MAKAKNAPDTYPRLNVYFPKTEEGEDLREWCEDQWRTWTCLDGSRPSGVSGFVVDLIARERERQDRKR